MKKFTPKQFLDKCSWEGGSIRSGFEYGLLVEHLDDSNPKFNSLMEKYQKAYFEFLNKIEGIEDEACKLVGYKF